MNIAQSPNKTSSHFNDAPWPKISRTAPSPPSLAKTRARSKPRLSETPQAFKNLHILTDEALSTPAKKPSPVSMHQNSATPPTVSTVFETPKSTSRNAMTTTPIEIETVADTDSLASSQRLATQPTPTQLFSSTAQTSDNNPVPNHSNVNPPEIATPTQTPYCQPREPIPGREWKEPEV
jgi:hypothetical protein